MTSSGSYSLSASQCERLVLFGSLTLLVLEQNLAVQYYLLYVEYRFVPAEVLCELWKLVSEVGYAAMYSSTVPGILWSGADCAP